MVNRSVRTVVGLFQGHSARQAQPNPSTRRLRDMLWHCMYTDCWLIWFSTKYIRWDIVPEWRSRLYSDDTFCITSPPRRSKNSVVITSELFFTIFMFFFCLMCNFCQWDYWTLGSGHRNVLQVNSSICCSNRGSNENILMVRIRRQIPSRKVITV